MSYAAADTVFEITPERGETLRVTWREVMNWANTKAATLRRETLALKSLAPTVRLPGQRSD